MTDNSKLRLLFIGDSITDCGRSIPQSAPLGCGYVKGFSHMWRLRHPERPLHILNRGIGGHTAEDLWSRWHDDVLAENPDVLVIMIGINDCNRYLTDPEKNKRQSPLAYGEYLHHCLEAARDLRPSLPILVISPFYLSGDSNPERYRGKVSVTLPEYIREAHKVAEKFETQVMDSQDAFQSILTHYPPSVLSNDMVHLNELGALALAEAVFTSVNTLLS